MGGAGEESWASIRGGRWLAVRGLAVLLVVALACVAVREASTAAGPREMLAGAGAGRMKQKAQPLHKKYKMSRSFAKYMRKKKKSY